MRPRSRTSAKRSALLCLLSLSLASAGCDQFSNSVTGFDLQINSLNDSRVILATVEVTYRGKQTLTDVEGKILLSFEDGTVMEQPVLWPEWAPGETKSVQFVRAAKRTRGAGIHGSAMRGTKRVTLMQAGKVRSPTLK